MPALYYADVPMCDIDVVDIVKGPNKAIFGMKRKSGVVSVFTRDGITDESGNESITGTLVEKIRGFERFRSF